MMERKVTYTPCFEDILFALGMINRNLEAMSRQLYDYWFVQFDFPDENGKPYKSSGGKMVWNEELKREIPEGWEVDRLGKVCDTLLGGTPDTENALYLSLIHIFCPPARV